MSISRGSFKDGKIQITPDRGSQLLYDIADRRKHEITMGSNGILVDKTLFYLPNNLLERTESTDGNERHFFYDKKVSRRRQYTPQIVGLLAKATMIGLMTYFQLRLIISLPLDCRITK